MGISSTNRDFDHGFFFILNGIVILFDRIRFRSIKYDSSMTLELEELSFLESFDWICFSYNSCAKNVSDWYKKKKKI